VVHSIYYTTPTAQIRLLLLLPPSLNPRTSPETFAISRTNYCTGPTLTQLLLGTDRKLKDFWINLKSKFDELRTLEVNSEDGEEDRSWKALHTRFQRKIQQEMFLGFRFVRESVIALHLASKGKVTRNCFSIIPTRKEWAIQVPTLRRHPPSTSKNLT
jgi:hypothetical protein